MLCTNEIVKFKIFKLIVVNYLGCLDDDWIPAASRLLVVTEYMGLIHAG